MVGVNRWERLSNPSWSFLPKSKTDAPVIVHRVSLKLTRVATREITLVPKLFRDESFFSTKNRNKRRGFYARY
ncbi:hypothetical protein TR13x_05595 [Caloranaerobacter sp. TR13]|nr:hypothetical protein TR13x_05595 [Caloranaerobacter sp. TR13]